MSRRPPLTAGRHCGSPLVAVSLAVLALVVVAPSARAASYQYWGYWRLTSGTWAFSQTGPTQSVPADGAVEGWRWAVADETGRPPRVVTTFDAVCAATPAVAGKKRVAVVVDFGRPVDGDGTATPPDPVAECAQVGASATGADVLAATTAVRYGDAGLVCGIDDYPATGCGGDVPSLSDAQRAADASATLGPTATAQGPASTQGVGPTVGTIPVPSATVGPVGPLATGQPLAAVSSGVPPVVWVGLVILLAGAALLAFAAYRRRRLDD